MFYAADCLSYQKLVDTHRIVFQRRVDVTLAEETHVLHT